MAANPLLFWNDRMHSSQTARVLTSSTTVAGYAPEYVREANLDYCWKPNDSASTDEWLVIDGSAVLWLGSAGGTNYFAFAYDARGSNQNVIRLQYGTVDDGAFAAPIDVVAHTLNKADVGIFYFSFSGVQKRYFRLLQKGTDRSGGNVTAQICYWGMYSSADVTDLGGDFPGVSVEAWVNRQVFRAGQKRAAGGLRRFNRWAEPGQEFTIPFNPASVALWLKIRDEFDLIGGPERAIFVQYEGLKNAALADFSLCRLTADWEAKYVPVSQYQIPGIQMETEPWR